MRLIEVPLIVIIIIIIIIMLITIITKTTIIITRFKESQNLRIRIKVYSAFG